MKPQRIQRKRVKGWKSPDNCKYCGRPTKWGNPFITLQDITYYYSDRRRKLCIDPLVFCCHKSNRDAVELYREGLKDPKMIERFMGGYDGKILADYFINILSNIDELRQYDYLSCFCPLDQKCHIDVLIEML